MYRRYRPVRFADMIGQDHVTGPLRQALRTDRLNHAYLFSGPRGCGKTTSARILARTLNCHARVGAVAPNLPDEACGECPSCIDLSAQGGGSLDVLEIDAASHNGVDDARDLRERAVFAPVRDQYKVFVIDEAHMVTPAGFNALLKIVEEPPEHIRFVFATTEPEKVIGTIRSRTHHYPFRLVGHDVLTGHLEWVCAQEQFQVEAGVMPLVIRAGAGSVRDSLSVLDQLMGGSGGSQLTYEHAVDLLGFTHSALLDDVVTALAAGDGAAAFAVIDRVVNSGQDPRRFVEDLLERLRDLIITTATRGDFSVLGEVPPDQQQRLLQQAQAMGPHTLTRSAEVTNAALTEMAGATSPRLHLELLLARLLTPVGADGLATRVERLERGTPAGGAAPLTGAPSAGTPAPGGTPGVSGAPQTGAMPPAGADVASPQGVPATGRSGADTSAPGSPTGLGAPTEHVAPPSPMQPPPAASPETAGEPSGMAPGGMTQPGAGSAGYGQVGPFNPAAGPGPDAPAASGGRASSSNSRQSAGSDVPVESGPDTRPSAAQQPPQDAGDGNDEVTLRRLQAEWDTVLGMCRNRRRTTWSALQHASVVSVVGNVVLLSFHNDGALRMFNRQDHTQVTADVIGAYLGRTMRVTTGEQRPVTGGPSGGGPSGGGGMPMQQTPTRQHGAPGPAAPPPAPQPAAPNPYGGAPAPSPDGDRSGGPGQGTTGRFAGGQPGNGPTGPDPSQPGVGGFAPGSDQPGQGGSGGQFGRPEGAGPAGVGGTRTGGPSGPGGQFGHQTTPGAPGMAEHFGGQPGPGRLGPDFDGGHQQHAGQPSAKAAPSQPGSFGTSVAGGPGAGTPGADDVQPMAPSGVAGYGGGQMTASAEHGAGTVAPAVDAAPRPDSDAAPSVGGHRGSGPRPGYPVVDQEPPPEEPEWDVPPPDDSWDVPLGGARPGPNGGMSGGSHGPGGIGDGPDGPGSINTGPNGPGFTGVPRPGPAVGAGGQAASQSPAPETEATWRAPGVPSSQSSLSTQPAPSLAPPDAVGPGSSAAGLGASAPGGLTTSGVPAVPGGPAGAGVAPSGQLGTVSPPTPSGTGNQPSPISEVPPSAAQYEAAQAAKAAVQAAKAARTNLTQPGASARPPAATAPAAPVAVSAPASEGDPDDGVSLDDPDAPDQGAVGIHGVEAIQRVLGGTVVEVKDFSQG